MSLLSHRKKNVKAVAIEAIGKIASGTPKQKQVVLDSGILEKISECLYSEDDNIIQKSLWLLSNIAAGSEDKIQAIIDANIMSDVIYFLENTNSEAVLKVRL